ncbi:MAG: hypothetical protein K6T91_08055 [Firmicutes bacterium]|nr:hypothetical protein [Bacillota bacterium]
MKARPLVIAGIVASALLLGGAYSAYASAQNIGSYPPIVEKLAKAFNLDPAKVNKVFQDDRDERRAQARARFEARLDQAVKDKKITQAQKDAILKKIDEVNAKLQSIKGLSPADRRTEMEKLREDLKAWAKQNGLDKTQFIPGLKGFIGPWRFKHGRGFMHGPEWFKYETDTAGGINSI